MAITKYVYITPAGAGLKDGTTIANAMGVGEYQTYKNGAIVAGDVPVIFDGAYTMTASIDSSARDGTAASPICEIGVKAGTTNEPPLYSDWSRAAADRPVFTAAAYTFTHGDYEFFHNIELSITAANGWNCGEHNTLENCKMTNSSATANRYGVNGSYLNLINSEAISTAGTAAYVWGYCFALFDYVHDSNYGIFATNGNSIIGNVVDTCTTANFYQQNNHENLYLNNTSYAGARAIRDNTTGYGNILINNICEGQTTSGISWGTQRDYNVFMNNHGDDARCTDMWVNVDVTTVFQDYWVTTGDPLLSSPAAGLFDLGTGSPCKDNGLANTLIAAASTINKGAWMTPVVSTAAPTFAGITKFEILSNNKFYVEWAAGTGTITEYRIYIRNGSSSVFSSTYLAKGVSASITSAIIAVDATQTSLPTAGATYHCGVKAVNGNTEDTNTATLSNICSGSELIQRMTNTILSV